MRERDSRQGTTASHQPENPGRSQEAHRGAYYGRSGAVRPSTYERGLAARRLLQTDAALEAFKATRDAEIKEKLEQDRPKEEKPNQG